MLYFNYLASYYFTLYSTSGQKKKLSDSQENRLKNYIIFRSKIGSGLTRPQIARVIKDVLDKNEQESGLNLTNDDRLFPDNLPSPVWVHRFVKRHPTMSMRTPEHLGHQRKMLSETQLREWFKQLEDFFFSEHRIIAKDFFVPENASRIFNLDESGFPLGGGKKLKVVAERGVKNVYNVSTESKESITVLACVSADGSCQKPYVIFPGLRQPNYNFRQVDPSKYDVAFTPNGWISSESFFCWLSNLFYPTIKDSVQFPVVVFMDNHSSHINLATVEFCINHKIILYCFPPHASHVMQPLDICVFGPLKKLWNTALNNFKIKYNQVMNRTMFFTVFDEAWEACKTNKANIVSGFKKSGLIPLDPDALDYSRLIDEAKAAKVFKQSGNELSAEQKLGIMRSLKCFNEHLPEATIKNFETRFQEGYDCNDDSAEGKLYKIFRSIKRLFQPNASESQIDCPSRTAEQTLVPPENPPVIDASSAQAIEIDPSAREMSISNHGLSNDTVDRELMSHKFDLDAIPISTDPSPSEETCTVNQCNEVPSIELIVSNSSTAIDDENNCPHLSESQTVFSIQSCGNNSPCTSSSIIFENPFNEEVSNVSEISTCTTSLSTNEKDGDANLSKTIKLNPITSSVLENSLVSPSADAPTNIIDENLNLPSTSAMFPSLPSFN